VRAQTERCLHHLHEGHSLTASSHRRALEPIRITRVTRAGGQKAAPRGARREHI
jgi:hypothetical protein